MTVTEREGRRETDKHREREADINRETVRETATERGRQTDRQAGRQTGRQAGRNRESESLYYVISVPDKVPGEIKRSRDLEEGGGAGPSN